jgi:hypothetical protein
MSTPKSDRYYIDPAPPLPLDRGGAGFFGTCIYPYGVRVDAVGRGVYNSRYPPLCRVNKLCPKRRVERVEYEGSDYSVLDYGVDLLSLLKDYKDEK